MLNGFFNKDIAAAGGAAVPGLSHRMDDGTAEHLSMSAANFGNIQPYKMVFTSWVKRITVEDTQNLFDMGRGSGNTPFKVVFRSDGRYDCNINTDQGTLTVTTDVVDVNDLTTWMHVYARYDPDEASGAEVNVWQDGSLLTKFGSASRKGTPLTHGPVYIGNREDNPTAANNLDAFLYQPALITAGSGDTLPSASDIYNGGTPIALTDVLADGTIHFQLDPDTDVTADRVLSASWTNNNTVTTDSDIP